MRDVTIYTKLGCPYCSSAKQLLRQKGVAYTEIDITGDSEARRLMIERSGRQTVPQVFVGDRHLGGCDDLYALEHAGMLDPLLVGLGA